MEFIVIVIAVAIVCQAANYNDWIKECAKWENRCIILDIVITPDTRVIFRLEQGPISYFLAALSLQMRPLAYILTFKNRAKGRVFWLIFHKKHHHVVYTAQLKLSYSSYQNKQLE